MTGAEPTTATRLCFVCLGNICRSPTAAWVMRDLVDRAGLAHLVTVESAGTGGWHVGEPADARARAEARRRGLDTTHRARQFRAEDFDRFDLVLAMDAMNLRDLHRLARSPAERDRVRLLRDHDPAAPPGAEVPDPYYEGPEGFAVVFDLVAAACRGLLDELAPGD